MLGFARRPLLVRAFLDAKMGSPFLGSLVTGRSLRFILAAESGMLMMRRTRRIRDYPPLPWVNPDQCLHPAPVTLLKFNEADETLLRCVVCREIITASERGVRQR
jgi:hypothetical protein